jgi:hypothetical protein
VRALSVGVLSWCALMSISFVASAQDQPAPAQGEPPPPATATPAPEPAPAPAPQQPAEPPDEGHLRWGISPMAGTFFPGPTTVAIGIEGRVGYAFNQTVTVYGSIDSVAGVGFGGDFTQNGASASVSAISYWAVGANVDALLAGPLFVGAGAAIGRGGWGVVSQSASSSGGSQEVIAAGGTMPSANARLGLHVGKTNEKTGKRPGFAIAFDLRVLIAPDSASTSQSAGSGGASQSVTTDTTAVGYSPMLMLGYDLR